METLKSNYWERLKKMQCPKCNRVIRDNSTIGMYECTNEKCTFKISHDIFINVVTDLYKPKKQQVGEYENLSALNNL